MAKYAFDRNRKPDVINRITLDYHRVTRMRPECKPEDAEWKCVTWNYTERLIIDRETESLEHIQNIGTGCRVSRKYEIEDGIDSLLESFDAEELFSHIQGNPGDVMEKPDETREYTITIDYKERPGRTITGTFDKNGLPEDFAYFAETVLDFILFYGLGEILSPSVYGRARRRKSDYIFCSVVFEEGYKSYYYLTDDDSIKDRKPFCTDLKTIYQAPTEEKALEALERVTEKWSEKYPNSMRGWKQNWDAISPIFKFSTTVRKVIYTTNAIESLNATYRKLNRQRSVFPSDTALLKALYLSTFEATKKWTMPIRNWGQVYRELSIMYEGRLTE